MFSITLKTSFLCLLILLICFSLCSCAQPYVDDDFPFESLLTVNPEANTAEATVKYYRVVVPGDCSSELLNAAKAFAASITEKTGIDASVVYDNEIDGRDILVTEIVLGNADRDISSFLMKDLREGDYLCSSVEGTIVIGGKSEAATLQALERFCSELLPKATSLYLMNPDDAFTYRAEYDEPTFTLNTYDINEYSIVYSTSSGENVSALANKLQSLILEKSGCRINLSSDLSYSGKKIELSLSSEGVNENTAYLIPQGKNIILRAKDTFGLSVAVRELIKYLFDGNGSFTLSSIIDCPYNDSTYTIASVEREGLFPLYSANDANLLMETVFAERSPDAVFFGGMTSNDEWMLQDQPTYICKYESYGQDSLAYCTETDALELISASEYENGAPLVFIYQINLGDSAFLLVRISGYINSDIEIKLSALENPLELPMLVMIHTHSASDAENSVTLDGADIINAFDERYLYDGYSYTFSCYATKNTFNISADGALDNMGYRCISAQKLSVFD